MLVVLSAVVLSVTPPPGESQSLGEVAQRTKDERLARGVENVDSAAAKTTGHETYSPARPSDGPAPSFDDDDLKEMRERNPSTTMSVDPQESKRPQIPENDARLGPETPVSGSSSSEARLVPDHRERREQWHRQWKRAMEAAERTLSEAEDDAYQCRAVSRYFYVPISVDCSRVPERVADARAKLRELRRNRYSWDGTANDDHD